MKKILILSLICLSLFVNIISIEAQQTSYFSNLDDETVLYGEAYGSFITESGFENVIDENYQLYNSEQIASRDTIFNIGSITKIYTTVAILQLEEQGLLSTNDKLDKFYPQVTGEFKNITIEMLLTHSSGITIREQDEVSVTKQQALDRIFSSELTYKPGDDYYYSNSGFLLLGAIVEDVSKIEYEQYIKENIIDPLELTNTGFPGDSSLNYDNAVTGFVAENNMGNVIDEMYGWESKAYTNILSTASDMTKFVSAIVNNVILSEQQVLKMIVPYFQVTSGAYRGLGLVVSYDQDNNVIYSHTGSWYGGNSFFAYRPADNFMIFNASNDIIFGSYYPASTLGHKFINTYRANSFNELDTIDEFNFPVLVQDVEVEQSNAKLSFVSVITIISGTLVVELMIFFIYKLVTRK